MPNIAIYLFMRYPITEQAYFTTILRYTKSNTLCSSALFCSLWYIGSANDHSWCLFANHRKSCFDNIVLWQDDKTQGHASVCWAPLQSDFEPPRQKQSEAVSLLSATAWQLGSTRETRKCLNCGGKVTEEVHSQNPQMAPVQSTCRYACCSEQGKNVIWLHQLC